MKSGVDFVIWVIPLVKVAAVFVTFWRQKVKANRSNEEGWIGLQN